MKKRFFQFEEETTDMRVITYIFPMSCNLGAFKMLHRAFSDLDDSNYRVYYFDVECQPDEFINYNAISLSKNVRVINGIIDTHRLKKYITALEEDGDDYFVERGILNLVAYFHTNDMIF